MRSVGIPARNANGIESRKVIGVIKKLARNFIILPALEGRHSRCIKILAIILMGVAHPNDQKNLAMVDRMMKDGSSFDLFG